MKYLPPIRELIIVLAVTMYGLAIAKFIERLGNRDTNHDIMSR